MEDKRYSENELLEFKKAIEQKLAKAQNELASILDSLSNTNKYIEQEKILDVEDDFSLVGEQEDMTQLANRLRRFIKHLEGALARIKNKTYGVCRETGRLISRERLLLVPHTTLSIEAKSRRYN